MSDERFEYEVKDLLLKIADSSSEAAKRLGSDENTDTKTIYWQTNYSYQILQRINRTLKIIALIGAAALLTLWIK